MPADHPGPDGIAVVDKDPAWTSHDVVARARKILGTRKVGHSGTLDPDATGVLVLGVGRGTRLMRFLTASSKAYACQIVMGVETTTLDDSGDVVATYEMAPSVEEVSAAAADLTGAIEQVPPMVSAVQVGGKRLYDLARQGIEVEREPRPVTVHRFEVAPSDEGPPVWDAEVECSSGTYVRSLAADLGRALGGGAHLRNLRRSAVGPFTLADARPLESIELLPLSEAWRGRPRVEVGDDLLAAVKVGRVLAEDELGGSGEGPWGVLTGAGELVAVYEKHKRGTVKPAVVLFPA